MCVSVCVSVCVCGGPYMGNLEKEGLALRFRAKMAPSGRDEGVD